MQIITYCLYIVFTKVGYFNINLKSEKIFIKIQNSFSKYVKRSLLLIEFHLKYCILEENAKITISGKKRQLYYDENQISKF
jgi:hypothetical protein